MSGVDDEGADRTWWFGSDKRWREGEPPAGWRQGLDGRWYPPEDMETVEIAAPRHMAGGGRHTLPDDDAYEDGDEDGRGPVSLGVVGMLTALVLVVSGIVFVASLPGSGEDGDEDASEEDDGTTGAVGSTDGERSIPTGSTDGGTGDLDPASVTGTGPDDGDGDGGTDPDDPGAPEDPGGGSPTTTQGEGRPTTTDPESTTTTDPEDCEPWSPPGRPDHPGDPGPPSDCR